MFHNVWRRSQSFPGMNHGTRTNARRKEVEMMGWVLWVWIPLRVLAITAMLWVMIRITGMRLIGAMSALDTMVGFSGLIVSGIAMVIFTIPLGIVLEIDGMLALIHRMGTWSIQYGNTFGWIQGKPIPVIKNGVIQVHGLKKAHFSKEELFMQLRNLEISRVDEVELATLEPDGRLGIILKEEATPLNSMLAKKTIYDDLFDVLQVPQASNADQEYDEIVNQCPDSMGKNHWTSS